MWGQNSVPGMLGRTSNSYFFCIDEHFYDYFKPDSGGIWKCTSGNDSFYIETGRTFDSGALRLECIARSARCYLRTGIDGLCGSSPFYCNLAVETQENFIGENGQVAFFTGWCYADDSRLAE